MAIIARLVSTADPGRFVAVADHAAAWTAAFPRPARRGRRPRPWADARLRRLDRPLDGYESMPAVYIPLPTSTPTSWTVAALAAGRHMLREKPFAGTRRVASTRAGASGAALIRGRCWLSS